MSELYNRIEALCKERNISINKMCKESGASQGAIGDLKSGRTKKLSAENLQKIATYFAISVDLLLGSDLTEDLHRVSSQLTKSQAELHHSHETGFNSALAMQIQSLQAEAEKLRTRIADLEHSVEKKPTVQDDGLDAQFAAAIKMLCPEDQDKLKQLMDSLANDPERTKAKFALFLETL